MSLLESQAVVKEWKIYSLFLTKTQVIEIENEKVRDNNGLVLVFIGFNLCKSRVYIRNQRLPQVPLFWRKKQADKARDADKKQ